MARRASRRSSSNKRRITYSYVGKKTRAEIREAAKYVPSVAKLKGKKRLTAAEKSTLTRAKKQLQYSQNLRPITEKQAKLLKARGEGDLIVGKGVRAIRLNNTSPNAKIRVKKSGVVVSSNGRTWEYHPVSSDVDALAEYGEAQLERDDVIQIALWMARGRSSEGFEDGEDWVSYLSNTFAQYQNQQDFTKGIAVEIRGKRNGK